MAGWNSQIIAETTLAAKVPAKSHLALLESSLGPMLGSVREEGVEA